MLGKSPLMLMSLYSPLEFDQIRVICVAINYVSSSQILLTFHTSYYSSLSEILADCLVSEFVVPLRDLNTAAVSRASVAPGPIQQHLMTPKMCLGTLVTDMIMPFCTRTLSSDKPIAHLVSVRRVNRQQG